MRLILPFVILTSDAFSPYCSLYTSRLYKSKPLYEKVDPKTDLSPRPPSTGSEEEGKKSIGRLLSMPKKIVEPLVEPGIEKDVPKETLGGSLIFSFLAAYVATVDVALATVLAGLGGYLALTPGPLGDTARGLGSVGMKTLKILGGVTQETTAAALEIAEQRNSDLEAAMKAQKELLATEQKVQNERLEKLDSMEEKLKELDDLLAVEKKWNKKSLLVSEQRRLQSEKEQLATEIKAEGDRIANIKAVQEKNITAKEFAVAERKRKAAERKAERERIAAEKKAEKERLAAEKAEQERIKAEQERIKAEKIAEEERLAAEKAEKDRIAAEKKAEEERIAAEIERKKIEEEEKIAAEIEKQQRLAAEWQRRLEERKKRRLPCDQEKMSFSSRRKSGGDLG
eukprot:CAMPEP_0172518008 /NCGR_PEP_ID=MMETSP1066-20121228/289791_1 /TAXON_ID=671091 /ORGANISM="Coscinodiscus wailesii, Strain CCMP2513" /LENGTH=397 /DNA_ID=CAMNT_0013300275 /DNA_START=72 /DNA_END=1265 /DNA_ORIENTATION=+